MIEGMKNIRITPFSTFVPFIELVPQALLKFTTSKER